MSFTSIQFFGFLIILLAVLVVVQQLLFRGQVEKRKRYSHLILTAAGYIFYAAWDWRFCFLLLFVTALSYFGAKLISRNCYKKQTLILCVAIMVAILGFFKYTNFFLDSFAALFRLQSGFTLNIILPLGISFYIFRAISYIADVYKGKFEPVSDFFDFALYISFFPQLTSGPILTASEFMPQLSKDRTVHWSGIEKGVQIFLFGLVKKVVIADNLSVIVKDVFAAPAAFSWITVWLAVFSYSIQIYCDFSGYSDMAVGCAACLGYDTPKNFNLPYISKNVSEFWKRWHISLSSWLMQYIYIPLGGNRKGSLRQYLNLLITMVVGGLWHGASWTYVFWGFLNGAALCLHKWYRKHFGDRLKPGKCADGISILLTFLFISFTWVFFRASSFSNAVAVLRQMVPGTEGINQYYSWSFAAIILMCLSTLYALLRSRKELRSNPHFDGKKNIYINGYYLVLDLNRFWNLVFFFVVIGLVLGLMHVEGNPFIYAQF